MEINKHYDLQTISASVLGLNIKNLKLKKIINFVDAVKEDSSLLFLNENVYGSISQLPVPSPYEMTFYVFEDANSKDVLLAKEWIIPNSMVLVNIINTLTIIVSDVTPDDSLMIQEMLRNIGITKFAVS